MQVELLLHPNSHSYLAKNSLMGQQEPQLVECYQENATTSKKLYYMLLVHMNILSRSTIWTLQHISID